MALKKNKIKSALDIHSTIRRMAYQLYEANMDENKLVLVGIEKKGTYLSKLIGLELSKISTIKLIHVSLNLNKKEPLNRIESSLPISQMENHSIVIIDDVLNTGSTLIYAVNYFLQISVKQIKTVVLVNRNHKKYPIKADFKGLSLSTSLNNHVSVVFEGDESGIYLS
ncbi:phosphoribosyltransferase family protein [Flavobacteriaceae bacterium]|jgi:pyrimidine operon attenuation protein/uracil phosphoribosyltransferase|nr:phosphoribosyltransferase family protein [Flavobacteriaceae bacterium]